MAIFHNGYLHFKEEGKDAYDVIMLYLKKKED